MSSARPYRPALCSEKILKELRHGVGSQFDSELIEIFIGLIEAGFPEKQEQTSEELSEPELDKAGPISKP